MHLARTFSLALFSTELRFPDYQDNDGKGEAKIIVTFCPRDGEREPRTMHVPLEPDVDGLGLKENTVDMHRSKTSAHVMPEMYGAWFSECLGYEVRLVYLGGWRRGFGEFDAGEY